MTVGKRETSSMMSCAIIVPKRNERSQVSSTGSELKKNCGWIRCGCPWGNHSSVREKDMWPDTMRWAVQPVWTRNSPQVLPVSLTKRHLDRRHTPGRKRKPDHVKWVRHGSDVSIVNSQWETTIVKCGKVCIFKSKKYHNFAQSGYGRFPKDGGTGTDPEGWGKMCRGEGTGRQMGHRLVTLLPPRVPQPNCQLHKRRIQAALTPALVTTARREHSRCPVCRDVISPVRMRPYINPSECSWKFGLSPWGAHSFTCETPPPCTTPACLLGIQRGIWQAFQGLSGWLRGSQTYLLHDTCADSKTRVRENRRDCGGRDLKLRFRGWAGDEPGRAGGRCSGRSSSNIQKRACHLPGTATARCALACRLGDRMHGRCGWLGWPGPSSQTHAFKGSGLH